MPGVNWEYMGVNKSKIYWSISSDNYLYLGQLFIDFDFKFNQTLGHLSSEFVLTDSQIKYLIKGVGYRIDKLLKDFDPNVPSGLSFIETKYQGKDLKLFVRMSRHHRLINDLIKFHDFLERSADKDIDLLFYGGEME